MTKKLHAASALILLAMLLTLLLSACGGKRVNLQDYVELTFSGADGYGRAAYSLDENALIDLIAPEDEEESLEAVGNVLKAAYLVEDIDVTLDVTEGLSNGDEVTVTVTYSDDLTDALGGVKPKSGESWTVKVSGLPEAEEADLFEDVSVTFSGYDGFGQAEVQDGSGYSGLTYTLSSSEDLSNGDIVTLTVSASSGAALEEYCANNYGLVPAAASRDYTVSGLEEVEEIDLFADLDVTVMGNSPCLSLSILGKYEDDGITYQLEDSDLDGSLAAGDTVTIRAAARSLFVEYDLNEYCLENLGALPASDTYTYTIGEDVSVYITETGQLSGDVLEALKSEAQDQFDAAFSKSRYKTLNSVSYYGYYLMTAKRYTGRGDYNRVYILQEVSYTEDGVTQTHYNAVEFTDVIIWTDGACHYDGVSNVYSWSWADGAETLYDFESEYITPELDKYNDASGA